MPRFIETQSGSFRRTRCRFGGNKAWKQHDREDTGTAADYRTRREQIEGQLAIEELFEAVDGSGNNRRRRRNEHKDRAACSPTPFAPTRETAPQAVSVMQAAPTKKCQRRFKVVISESGRMVVQYLS